MWHPHGDHHDGIRIGAFAEEGRPLQIPGPLVRVPAGTEVRTTVHNALDGPLAVFGLGRERGLTGDSVLIQPHRSADFRFVAGRPGTYYYVAKHADVPDQDLTGTLHGAIIVDPPGTTVASVDRVLVISSWFTIDTSSFSHLFSDAGYPPSTAWPGRTPKLVEATQGDTLQWRWINLTELQHPMHLHGFHFRVDARGDGTQDTLYPPERRWRAVTEHVASAATVTTVWSPERPGNWIFHCHMLSHMSSHGDHQQPAG